MTMPRFDVILRIVHRSMTERLVLRICYRAEDGRTTQRDIEVRDVQRDHCRAWCHLRHEMRTFRLDRIAEARILADAFMPDSIMNSVDERWVRDIAPSAD